MAVATAAASRQPLCQTPLLHDGGLMTVDSMTAATVVFRNVRDLHQPLHQRLRLCDTHHGRAVAAAVAASPSLPSGPSSGATAAAASASASAAAAPPQCGGSSSDPAQKPHSSVL